MSDRNFHVKSSFRLRRLLHSKTTPRWKRCLIYAILIERRQS